MRVITNCYLVCSLRQSRSGELGPFLGRATVCDYSSVPRRRGFESDNMIRIVKHVTWIGGAFAEMLFQLPDSPTITAVCVWVCWCLVAERDLIHPRFCGIVVPFVGCQRQVRGTSRADGVAEQAAFAITSGVKLPSVIASESEYII